MVKLGTYTAILGLVASSAMADVTGVWQTERDDLGRYAHVEIAPCGDSLCGTMIKGFDKDNREGSQERTGGLLGKRLIWDMKADGANNWKGGKVYAPDRDRTYNAKMELNGNTLAVSGCVLMFCRAQNWKRVQ